MNLPFSPRICRRFVLGLSLLCLGVVRPARAQDAGTATTTATASGIVFLHVRFKADGTLELLEAQTRPGKLKGALAADAHGAETLSCQVVSPTGAALWTGKVADPSTQRVEYEDPAQPGRLLSKSVSRPGAEFMVRVPLYQKTQRVEFRRPVAATETAAAQSAAAAPAAGTDKLVGSFDLTLP